MEWRNQLLNVNPNEQPDAPGDHDNAPSRCLDITLAVRSAIIEQTLDNAGEIIDIVGSYRDLAIRLAYKLQEVDGQKGEKLTDVIFRQMHIKESLIQINLSLL